MSIINKLNATGISIVDKLRGIITPEPKFVQKKQEDDPLLGEIQSLKDSGKSREIVERAVLESGEDTNKAKQYISKVFDTATDPEQWKALGQIVQTGREEVGNLPGIKQAREFLTPESDEAARRSGLIKIGNSYIDPMGISSLERAGSKAVAKGAQTLTTRFLEYLKGKKTVSRQEVLDFANRPELKKGEADLLSSKIQDFTTDKLPAQDFADSIRRDLLELKPVKVKDPQYRATTIQSNEDWFMNKNKNYEEVVFESPITTNGSSHFPNSKNYFAHARGDEVVEGGKKIWREQEIQSDLLQKDNLEKMKGDVFRQALNDDESFGAIAKRFGQGDEIAGNKLIREKNTKELSSLDPFTNDRFGERIMRERIKEKAQKGYEKYRLPTGETIGKIEGFGNNDNWLRISGEKTERIGSTVPFGELKVGDTIARPAEDSWIITDILGDGRFKAVPKNVVDNLEEELVPLGYTSPDDVDFADEKVQKVLRRLMENETFDISGKSNPQYRRYEQWGKFLKNKYGAKQVTDPQGNSWYEIDLKPEYATDPVLAFGKTNVGTMAKVGGAIAAGALAPLLGAKKTYNIDLSKPEAKIEEPQKQETAQLRKAILLNETSVIPEEKRYSYRRHSNQPGLGYANGAYQVTDGELKAYSDDLLGRVVTPKEFLASPELQDAYMDAKIQRLRDKGYSDEEILGIHFGGINADLSSSAIQDYIKKGLEKLKLISAQAADE